MRKPPSKNIQATKSTRYGTCSYYQNEEDLDDSENEDKNENVEDLENSNE